MTRRGADGWYAMANEGLDEIIADTYEALGFHARAAMMRDGVETAESGYADPDPVLNDIYALLEQVPSNTDKHKHVEGNYAHGDVKAVAPCWHARAQCLAEKLRGMIDDHA